MKKIFTLLLILCFQINIRAQVTYHFPHSNAVWGQFTGTCCFPGLTGTTNFLTANGDTIIGGFNYIKLYQSDSTGSVFYDVNDFIREDSSGRVYYYSALSALDTMLYDFNLSVGDTAKVFAAFSNFNKPVVDSINYISIFNQSRKCIYFNQPSYHSSITDFVPLHWIEGIGSSDGLLFPYGGYYIIDGVVWLTCFKENDTLKYGDVCNQVFVGIDNILSTEEIKISPNPSNGIVEIELTKNKMGGELMIYNSVGQLVIKNLISNSVNKISINLSNKPDGIYLVRIINGNKIISSKLLLQRKN